MVKVKSIQEYENQIFNGQSQDLIREKAETEHLIAKCQTELQFSTQQLDSTTKQIDSLKGTISEEEMKVRSIFSAQQTQSKAAKMQEQLRECEDRLQSLTKER